MSECAGSCGITRQTSVMGRQQNPMDHLRENFERRRIAKQEIRKNELIAKGDNSNLSTAEAMELAGYKIQDGLEKMAQLGAGSICYMA